MKYRHSVVYVNGRDKQNFVIHFVIQTVSAKFLKLTVYCDAAADVAETLYSFRSVRKSVPLVSSSLFPILPLNSVLADCAFHSCWVYVWGYRRGKFCRRRFFVQHPYLRHLMRIANSRGIA